MYDETLAVIGVISINSNNGIEIYHKDTTNRAFSGYLIYITE